MSQLESSQGDERIFTGEWLRKASDSEKMMESYHQDGCLLIWYQLDLSSAEPLQEEHVRRAVAHLYRKVPSLNVCYGASGDDLWFRRATNPEIDFKVHRGSQLEEVRESLRNHSYKSETGPLFCARLVYDSPDIASDTKDLEPSFPFKSHIIFGLHHGMTDGTSNMNIMGFFISLLNDVISEKPINDQESLGHFASDEETMNLIMEGKAALEENPKVKKKIEDDILFQDSHTPFLVKCFTPTGKKERTSSIVRVLDEDVTSKFIQRCKQEKVTVGSVFTAVVNMAIVDVLVEYGVTEDSYLIGNFHTVNFRRFWKPKPSVPLGLHMGYPIRLFSDTPRNIHQKFWEYAKTIGESMRDYLFSGRMFAEKAYSMFRCKRPSQSKDRVPCDYMTSNMGDVTRLVTEGGDHVRITRVVRGTTFHVRPYPVFVRCHTFRGIFTVIFEYNEAKLQPEVAEKLCYKIVKLCREVAL
ncbi:uncharacterized protein LOC135217002 [Macrobrachium nipponense]|uniref:uncharacterized protein LOC135217002 n=1 Tax=Macrobrachium nipponense TaxID=159736 RepID=UPI0030C7CC21